MSEDTPGQIRPEDGRSTDALTPQSPPPERIGKYRITLVFISLLCLCQCGIATNLRQFTNYEGSDPDPRLATLKVANNGYSRVSSIGHDGNTLFSVYNGDRRTATFQLTPGTYRITYEADWSQAWAQGAFERRTDDVELRSAHRYVMKMKASSRSCACTAGTQHTHLWIEEVASKMIVAGDPPP